jgi:mannose-6-phosphate isomerase-like protein (cupin superfamily)
MTVARLAGRTLGDADSSFVIGEWTAEGAPTGPPQLIAPLHLHRHDDEVWYVLEGKLAFRLGEDVVEVRAGEAMFAPRGVAHTFWNPSPEPARYVVVMTPNTFSLVQEFHATTDRDPERMRALFERYDCELLGPLHQIGNA